MSRSDTVTLLPMVESYFHNYLGQASGASHHTVRSYRDTLRLLFKFLAGRRGCSVSALTLKDLDADAILAFLAHIEGARNNAIASRNLRLAAIRSFFRHLVENDIERAGQYQRVLSIPNKRPHIGAAQYLEPEEVRQLLAQPDCSTTAGLRDYALILFLYNTGARVNEMLTVRVEHLSMVSPRQVRLFGKRSKERFCPLWPETVAVLAKLPAIREGRRGDPVFCNRAGTRLSRDGVAYLLRKYTAMAARTSPAFRRRRVSPHTLRHSCAAALLQSGVDITVIRDYLGHASIATTNRYVATNLKMKRDALEQFWARSGLSPTHARRWKPKADVLAYLESI